MITVLLNSEAAYQHHLFPLFQLIGVNIKLKQNLFNVWQYRMKPLLLKCQHEPVLRTEASTASVRGLSSSECAFMFPERPSHRKATIAHKRFILCWNAFTKNHKPIKLCYSGSEENAEPKSNQNPFIKHLWNCINRTKSIHNLLASDIKYLFNYTNFPYTLSWISEWDASKHCFF